MRNATAQYFVEMDEKQGAVVLNACPMGENQVFVSTAFYLYGKGAAEAANKNEPLWKAWMKEHFGAASDAISA